MNSLKKLLLVSVMSFVSVSVFAMGGVEKGDCNACEAKAAAWCKAHKGKCKISNQDWCKKHSCNA